MKMKTLGLFLTFMLLITFLAGCATATPTATQEPAKPAEPPSPIEIMVETETLNAAPQPAESIKPAVPDIKSQERLIAYNQTESNFRELAEEINRAGVPGCYDERRRLLEFNRKIYKLNGSRTRRKEIEGWIESGLIQRARVNQMKYKGKEPIGI